MWTFSNLELSTHTIYHLAPKVVSLEAIFPQPTPHSFGVNFKSRSDLRDG